MRGFGAFAVKKRDARDGRNPRTGGKVAISEKHYPFFKTGKDLRDRLLCRVKGMLEKLNRVAQTYHGDNAHLETLTQVRRLTGVALKQIAHRFDELDAQTGEVMSALRNAESQRTFIRSNRDWRP